MATSLIDSIAKWKLRAGTNQYIKNVSWLIIEKIYRIVLSFFVSIFVVRFLGPKDFGALNYAISYVGIFQAFASLGIDSLVVRELLKDPSRKEEILGSSFSLKAFSAIVSMIVIVASTALNKEDDRSNALIIIVAIGLLFQTSSIIDSYFQSVIKPRVPVVANLIQFSVVSALRLFLVYKSADLIWFAWIVALDSIILCLLLLLFYSFEKKSFQSWKFSFPTAKMLLRDGYPLILSNVAIVIYMRADQVLIKNMLDASAVGIYSAAVRISELFYFIPTAIATAVFPAIYNAKKHEEKQYHDRLQVFFDVMTVMALLIAIPMSFFSDEIVLLLYGQKFGGASSVLTILSWNVIPVFLGVASSQPLLVDNSQGVAFIRTFLGGISSLIINFLLIPKLGIVGAAISSIISFSISSFVILLFFKKTRYILLMLLKSFDVPGALNRVANFTSRISR